jgi:threonine aldolase
LDHHIERLAEDHERTAAAARACAEAAPGSVDPARVETNILVLDTSAVGMAPTTVVTALADRGVRGYAVSATQVRLVWHLDVDAAASIHAVDALTAVLRG